jgi:hypothetical protein
MNEITPKAKAVSRRVKRLHRKKGDYTVSDQETPQKKLYDTENQSCGARDSPESNAQWGNVEGQSWAGGRNSTERK